MFSEFTLFRFLSRNSEPALRGVVIAFLAFALLIIPELFALFYTIKVNYLSLLSISVLLLSGAIIYAHGFNLILFLARFLAALFSHVENFFINTLPGVITFIILGQPIFDRFSLLINPAEPLNSLQSNLTFLVPAIVIAFIFLYRFPLLQGSNGSFFLVAAGISRFLLSPYAHYFNHAPAGYFVIYSVVIFSSTALFYATLQIRYRQSLANHYDYLAPPLSSILLATFLLLTSLAGLVLYQLGVIEYLKTVEQQLASFIRLKLFLVALLCGHWLVTSIWIRLVHKKRERLDSYIYTDTRNRIALAYISVIAIGALSFYTSFRILNLTGTINLIRTQNGIAHELLYITGSLLDFDGDGNSRWPGGDPDDSNDCIRRFYTAGCKRDSIIKTERPFILTNYSNTQKSVILFTIIAPDLNELEPDAHDYSYSVYPGKLFLPSDHDISALKMLLFNLNGYEYYSRNQPNHSSLFSEFSRTGFRTVCGGYDAGRGYLELNNDYRFDLGCQVFLPHNSKDEDIPELRSTSHRMISEFKKYSEKNSLLWLHHDLTGNSHKNKFDLDKFQTQLFWSLNELVKIGAVALVFINNRQNYISEVWGVSQKDLNESEQLMNLAELINFSHNQNLVLADKSIEPGISTQLNVPTWMLFFNQSRGREQGNISYTYHPDSLHFFDGITGAIWEEKIR